MAAPDTPLADDAPAQQEIEQRPDEIVTYWKAQLDAYDDEFKDWTKRCKRIIRRYRDERQEKSDGLVAGGARFNALWSNIQTLQPAIYIKPPQPVVERRYRDKDPLARTASMTLERACEIQIEVGKFHAGMRKSVRDYLLCGRATLWERYEPTYGEAKQPESQAADGTEPAKPVTYEKVCTDYVAWDKFRHSPANGWEDVWWVSKDEMLTRKELRAWLGDAETPSGKLLADAIPLRHDDKSRDKDDNREKKRRNPRALIVEIWNKCNGEVIFIAPDYAEAPVKTTPDPLNLADFWPCPPPLYGTLTNDSLVPIPDYAEYQDQADELDSLTARIKALTDAVRVNGVYDASIPELKRILQEGTENRMIGVKNWAELTTKGGLQKSMDFVPLKDIVAALLELYNCRERVKADMAEITGLSDIVRGQAASGQAKTATEQRIKGQFASLRLEDRKKEVARFARDAIAIKAEIISEQFSPEILAEMTGMLAFIADEIKAESPAQISPMMGHNGGPQMNPLSGGTSPPPVAGAPGGGLPSAGQPPMNGVPVPLPDPMQQAQQRFTQACELLRNDKMRTFRIDIETDSTIEPDRQAAKEAVTEMATAVGGLLEKSLPIGQAMPQLAGPLGQTLLFVLRTFGAGRDVEGIWEEAIDRMAQMAKNPPPRQPSPEQIKAQAEQQKMQMEAQAAQQQAALDQQKAQQEFQLEQMKAKLEIEREQMKLQLERERLQMERERLAMKLQGEQQKATIQAEHATRQAALDEQASARDAAAGEREHELGLEVMAAKAEQAKQPKAGATT